MPSYGHLSWDEMRRTLPYEELKKEIARRGFRVIEGHSRGHDGPSGQFDPIPNDFESRRDSIDRLAEWLDSDWGGGTGQ